MTLRKPLSGKRWNENKRLVPSFSNIIINSHNELGECNVFAVNKKVIASCPCPCPVLLPRFLPFFPPPVISSCASGQVINYWGGIADRDTSESLQMCASVAQHRTGLFLVHNIMIYFSAFTSASTRVKSSSLPFFAISLTYVAAVFSPFPVLRCGFSILFYPPHRLPLWQFVADLGAKSNTTILCRKTTASPAYCCKPNEAGPENQIRVVFTSFSMPFQFPSFTSHKFWLLVMVCIFVKAGTIVKSWKLNTSTNTSDPNLKR